MLARRFRPDAIYVDGAYMLQPERRGARGWEAVADTARGLKRDLASALDIPAFASYQFNKEFLKAKGAEKAGMHMVAGSQEIPWLATVLLGITEEDTVENQDCKRVDIMKGRNGEVGHYWVNWVFDQFPYMDFSQLELGGAQKMGWK